MGVKKSRKKTQLLSLDIGSHSIKFVVGQEQGDKIKLSEAFSVPLVNEVYENGNFLDPDAMKVLVESALRSQHIRVKDVVVSIESTEIIKREMVIPKVDPEDQADLIAYEVNQYLPIDTSAYVIQHINLEDFEEEGTQKSRILLGALPKEMVTSHFEWLKTCGLNPVFMDFHSNSIEKLINFSVLRNLYKDEKTAAFIDFGHKMINIGIYESGEYKFNRLLRMGGNAINQFISRHLELEYNEAEDRKEKTSIAALSKAYSEVSEVQDPKTMVVMDTVEYLNDCIEEVSKVFKYYTSRGQDHTIEKVYLYGGSSKFQDLSNYVSERLDIKVELLKTLPNVEISAKLHQDELPLYANAIGALIRR